MNDELTAVRVAELYYDENKTQDEIGALLRITRWKVGRLLAWARDEGIVRIEIVHPRARRLTVERELCHKYGLRDAIVVPTPAAQADVQPRVAQAAADYLTALRPVPETLGISWGRTLNDIADRLEPGWARNVTVVQINGGVTLNKRAGTAATTASTIAHKAGGKAILLPSPAILERIDTKLAIEADRTVAGVLELAGRADAYLYSAGAVDASSVLVDSGYLTDNDIAQLLAKGAVSDVVGRYIDANGNIVDPELDSRTVGLSLDSLRSAELAIFVVAGAAKHDVARTVVTNGLCSVLVTDEATAQSLVEENK